LKVIIIADMEGVSGITVWEQVIGGQAMYEEGRRLYTAEINAAIKGALQAGAEEVLVVD
jgi:D-amino peptidase